MLSKDDIERRLTMWRTVEDALHVFFSAHGFTQVRTPLLVRYPDLSVNLDPMQVRFDCFAPKKIPVEAALITSPEFSMKKLLGVGMEKIYTITSVFRGTEALAPHNSPEFSMLEWYHPAGYEQGMQFARELVNDVLKCQNRWPIIAHADANVDEHGDPHIDEQRFILADYPADQAALARLSKDGKTAERFELFADGFELANGYCELLDGAEQKKRFAYEQWQRKQKGKPVFGIDEELVEALDRIDGPVTGVALGVDRLVMLKYGVGDINDVQLFPAQELWSGEVME